MMPTSLLRRVFSNPDGSVDAEPGASSEPGAEAQRDPKPLSGSDHADRVRAAVDAYNQAAKDAVLAGMKIELDDGDRYRTTAGGEAPRLSVRIYEPR